VSAKTYDWFYLIYLLWMTRSSSKLTWYKVVDGDLGFGLYSYV